MKTIIIAAMLFATTLFGNEFNNGAVYVDEPVQVGIIQENGTSITNMLGSGRTLLVGKSVIEITTTNKTLVHLGGIAMLQAGVNSQFAITFFDQEISNLLSSPQRIQVGAYTLNLEFMSGEFCFIYPNTDTNLSVVVNTQMATYQLNGGKYYFKTSGKSTLVYVMEGDMVVHGDKNRVDLVDKGSLAIAVPFGDPDSGIDDKIITSFKQAKLEENEKFASPILQIEQKWNNVDFFVIDEKVVGIKMK